MPNKYYSKSSFGVVDNVGFGNRSFDDDIDGFVATFPPLNGLNHVKQLAFGSSLGMERARCGKDGMHFACFWW